VVAVQQGAGQFTPIAQTHFNTEIPTVMPFLTFSGAVTREPAIDRWFDAQPAELAALARRWFSVMRACGADVRELMHDGCPTACVHDAAFGYVNVFTRHVNVGFFHGNALPDPSGLQEGVGKHMRHVKLRPGSAANADALEALVTAAHDDIRARLIEIA
jgi:hypothetical protein